MEQSPRQFLKEQKELLETLKCEYEIENYDKCLKWTLGSIKAKHLKMCTLLILSI